MTFSTKISLNVSRKVVFSGEQPKGNSATLTGSNLKEIFGPANKKKRKGVEKKVLDELAEAWEGSDQTIHKRHRLLLGPSFAEVNFKTKQKPQGSYKLVFLQRLFNLLVPIYSF